MFLLANTFGMAGRKPKDETTARHTAKSFTHLGERLRRLASRLDVASTLLNGNPPIADVLVPYEGTRAEGIDKLETWVTEAEKASDNARDEAERNPVPNGRVRKTGHVSDRK